jgi:hypothetical protein
VSQQNFNYIVVTRCTIEKAVRAVGAKEQLVNPIGSEAIGNSTGLKASPRRSSEIFLAAIPSDEAEMIRPLKPKLKTILKVAIALAVIAFVLFLWASARPVPLEVRVTFTGFTNPPTLPLTQAYFCVSNAGRCSVFQEALQWIEIKNKPHDGLFDLVVGGRRELKPGEFKTISLSPPTEIRREPFLRVDDRGSLVSPTNLEPWRLKLSFSKVDWRVKLVRNPPSVLRKVLKFVPAKWFERHPIQVHSDWINGPPTLTPVATNTTNTPPK